MVDIGFIGLGHMGFPMARRLIDAGYNVIAFDVRTDALDGLVALGARRASSPTKVDIGSRCGDFSDGWKPPASFHAAWA